MKRHLEEMKRNVTAIALGAGFNRNVVQVKTNTTNGKQIFFHPTRVFPPYPHCFNVILCSNFSSRLILPVSTDRCGFEHASGVTKRTKK